LDLFDLFDGLESAQRQREALHRMVYHLWVTNGLSFMPREDAVALVQRLEVLPPPLEADLFLLSTSKLCCAMVWGQQAMSATSANEHSEANEASLRYALMGLVHEPALAASASLDARNRTFALTPQLHYWLAVGHTRAGRLLSAQQALHLALAGPKAANVSGTGVARLIQGVLLGQLAMRIEERLASRSESLPLGTAGVERSVDIAVGVGPGRHAAVAWEWRCDKGSAAPVRFRATFLPAAPATPVAAAQQQQRQQQQQQQQQQHQRHRQWQHRPWVRITSAMQ
jgi:hypothetical protein